MNEPIDLDSDVNRLSVELLDELASNERRLVDPRTKPARFHNLRACAISPAHGLASFQRSSDDSLARRIGSGTHALLFEDRPVFALPPHIKQRRGKAYDAWKATIGDTAIVLTAKEHARACRIVASIRANAIAMNILFGPGTVREQTILWEQFDRARQSTPDVRGPYHVAELKTARCTEPGKFVRDAGFRSYHVQLADQCAAVQHATGKWPAEVYVVAVESVEPFVVTVFQVSDATIRKGRRLAELWLSNLIGCERDNRWPGYSQGIELLDILDDGLDVWEDAVESLPDWAKPAEGE